MYVLIYVRTNIRTHIRMYICMHVCVGNFLINGYVLAALYVIIPVQNIYPVSIIANTIKILVLMKYYKYHLYTMELKSLWFNTESLLVTHENCGISNFF